MNGLELAAGGGAAVSGESLLALAAANHAELLLFDLA
jgi:Quercetinase C-terminal cupin domain